MGVSKKEGAVALQDYWYTLTLDGIKYFTPGSSEQPWQTPVTFAVFSSDYSLSCGISVGSTEQELLECFPNLEKSNVIGNETEGLATLLKSLNFQAVF